MKKFFCTCDSSYQDERYGKNQRICNKMNKDKNKDEYRCTVCGREHVDDH